MSSRFPPTNVGESRFPRDRTPPRSVDRRPPVVYNDGSSTPRSNEPGHRSNDSYGFSGRGREAPKETREPPRGPKALIDGPRGGGYLPRGRGSYMGRGDARERDFRDARDEPFARRGRGQDYGPRDRFERRPSPVGRDRSRSPLSRDFREPRDTREHPPREDPRRESREALPPISTDTFTRGRGGYRGRGRGRGDWDYNRDRALYPDERDTFGQRSRSRERDWERSGRDDRERERDFEPSRRGDDFRREQEDREREDRSKRDIPPFRPDSRNSTGGVPTPLTSRSTSTTSIHLNNMERYAQNSRESRETLHESRPRHVGSSMKSKTWSAEKDSDKLDHPPRRVESERFEPRNVSPPPQAPPVPAFGSVPPRAPPLKQSSPSKQASPTAPSPVVHPSRLSLVGPSRDAPPAPKGHDLSRAPTAPKAQQSHDRWGSQETTESTKRPIENDAIRFGGPQRPATGPAHHVTNGAAFDQVRNISKRFSNVDLEISPTRPSLPIVYGSSDPTQPSIRKAVEEQGRDGNVSRGAPTSTLRTPSTDTTSQNSPVKIPTGPRAERAPPSIRQPPPPSIRGPATRGPSMIPRTNRGGAWSWVNPDLPKHTPRGPSIMNSIPSKRDSAGEDKSKSSIPSSESSDVVVARWRRDHIPSPSLANTSAARKVPPSQPSPGIMHRAPARSPIEEEGVERDESMDRTTAMDQDKEAEESDDTGADDAQLFDEEDFAEAERKFDREMQTLELKRPPTPRSNPQLLELLEELDALASALDEKKNVVPADGEADTAQISLGLPSPKVDDVEEMDYKREASSSPLPIRERPRTPPLDSLPFLPTGPPTPFSEIEELHVDADQQDAVMNQIVQELMCQREVSQAEDADVKERFAEAYMTWRMSVEDYEDSKRIEIPMAELSDVDSTPVATPAPSYVGRRGRLLDEQAIDEVVKMSLNTAAKEERARREREAVYVPIDTFNPEREAVVPDMLSKSEAQSCMFADTNTLVDKDFALEKLCFIPKQDDFTDAESETYLTNYLLYPKRFGMIAENLPGRSFKDCVQHYYSTKLITKYKDQEVAFLKTKRGRKIASQSRGQIRPRLQNFRSTQECLEEYEAQNAALTERGRPRRAAAPTFGDGADEQPGGPAVTPARRGAATNKDNPTIPTSSEKPAGRRTRAPAKEKPGRKPRNQLLAAAPGPSPQKSVTDTPRVGPKDAIIEPETRNDDLESAQLLAGLSKGQTPQVYQRPAPEWPQHQQRPTSLDHIPQHVPQPGASPTPTPQQKAGTSSQTSSYWSVPEQQDFQNYVKHFGTNWQAIAAAMKTKTHIMIKNFYSRQIKSMPQLEQEAQQADVRISNGEDMGPLPQPTPTGEKRRYMYNILKQEHRPLAPSTSEGPEVENGSPNNPTISKPQNATRFKQDPPKFTALASAEQGAAQTSKEMMAQGPMSLENRITIPLQKQTQQQVIGPSLGTFVPEERSRVIFHTRDNVKEKEQREMQQRQQMHAEREREVLQRQQDREGISNHRHRLSKTENEPPIQTFQPHGPEVVSNPSHSSLLGQTPPPAPSGMVNAPEIELLYDEKTRIYLQAREREAQRQQQQAQQQAQQQQAQQQQAQQNQAQQEQQQQQQQQQQRQQHSQQPQGQPQLQPPPPPSQHQQQQHQKPIQQQQQQQQQNPILQPHANQQQPSHRQPLDIPTRRPVSGAFSNTPTQLSSGQSPTKVSQPMPPMSPPGEALRPSSVPVIASAQQPPPGPPKKSNIMNLLNDDSAPQPRKRLSDQQRPVAPTPPPQQPTYQPASQSMQQQMLRKDTPAEPLSHLQQQQQQQRPSISQQMQMQIMQQQQQQQLQQQQQQQQQQQSQLIEPRGNWATTAQQMGREHSRLEERPSQTPSIISPPSQSSYLPTSSRSAFQGLHRNHVPSPPPFPHPTTHSRTSSHTSIQPVHHHQPHTSIISTPAEPNIRPSPYTSLNQPQRSHQQLQQQRQQQTVRDIMHEQQRQQQAQEAQRQEQEHRLRYQQQQEEFRRRHEQERNDEVMRMRHEQVRREQEERDRRFGRPGGTGYYRDGPGPAGRGLGGGYDERR